MVKGKNITQFCAARGISRPSYYKWRRENPQLVPEEDRHPHRRDVIITPEAEKAYDKFMASREVKMLIKRQFELRSAQARLAGQKAAMAKRLAKGAR